jgi:SAM-dependent methyltransferase
MTDPSPHAEHDPAQIRARVGETWELAATGWTRWEPVLVGSFWPVTHALVRAARIAPGMHVLDVGCGIGDPALAVAEAVGPTGTLTGVDLSPRMIATCRARAAACGLGNCTFRTGAADAIDWPVDTFDAITGRFSIIFFPDVAAGLRRLGASLKPGGRLAVSVWTPPEVNPGFVLPTRELRAVVDLPAPDPQAPGPFRLSGEGELAAALAEIGLRDVQVEDVPFYLFARDAETYWEMLLDISAIFAQHFRALNAEQQAEVRRRILRAVEEYRCGDVLRLPVRARVGVGTNPPEQHARHESEPRP